MPNFLDNKSVKATLIVGIIVIIVWLITGFIGSNSNKNIEVDLTKIKENIVSEKLIKDYKTFLLIENVCNNYVELLINEKPNNTYKLLTQQMKDKYTYSKYKTKISQLTNDYFISKDANVFYNTETCLKRAYIVNESSSNVTVIVEIKTLTDDYMLVGLYIDKKSQTYKICFLEM